MKESIDRLAEQQKEAEMKLELIEKLLESVKNMVQEEDAKVLDRVVRRSQE